MPLSGLRIVFTGRMTKSRSEMTQIAQQRGASVDDRVTRATDWVVTGKNVGKVKTEAAKTSGCQMMTEAEYEKRYLGLKDGPAGGPTIKPIERKPFETPEWVRNLSSGSSVRF